MLEELAEAQAARLDEPQAYVSGDHEYQRQVVRIAGSVAVELLLNSFEKVLDRHRDLELAFMGPLAEHQRSYARVHALLRGRAWPGLRAAAGAVLDAVEAEGMDRVRALIEARAAAGGTDR